MLRYSNTFIMGGQYSFKAVCNSVTFNSIKHKETQVKIVYCRVKI